MIDDLKPLVDANHRKAIGALLRPWEERWIGKNKLETLWEPTPFPVELARTQPIHTLHPTVAEPSSC